MDDDETFGASKASRNVAAVSISRWVFGATFTVLEELGVRGGGRATPLRCLSAGTASIMSITMVFTGWHQ